ncbi:MAG: cobalamin B12-binding domain-containing protein [Candidatus Freyarchaeota archaeon]|nr:cobalamin-dependent protein [Candidatus Freyrarchaeum guaymaensis]
MNIEDLRKAIAEIKGEAKDITKRLLDEGVDPVRILEDGIVKGLYDLGDKFERHEAFIPDLVKGSKLARECIEMIEKVLPREKAEAKKKVVIGTMLSKHNIGKNLVSTFLTINGFEVHDLGENLEPWDFYEKAEEIGADIIAVSVVFTPALSKFEELIRILKEMGVRDKYKVLVGGAVTSKEWAEKAGADGWAGDVEGAVKAAKELLGVS